MTFLIVEEVNLLSGFFLAGEISKFLAVGWDSSPIPRVSYKCLREIMGYNSGR